MSEASSNSKTLNVKRGILKAIYLAFVHFLKHFASHRANAGWEKYQANRTTVVRALLGHKPSAPRCISILENYHYHD